MLFKSTAIEKMHEEYNSEANIPKHGFRRNSIIYELVCYINNIIACYVSKNEKPIPIFIERAKVYVNESSEKEELSNYLNKVKEYLEVMESHLQENGVINEQ